MRTINYISILILSFFIGTATMKGQEFTLNERIEVKKNSIEQVYDQLVIDVTIDILPKSVPYDSFFKLTPVLKSTSGDSIILPEILVNGTNRNRAYNRAMGLNDEVIPNLYQVLKSSRKDIQPIEYKMSMPFEKWMDGAELKIIGEMCNCGDDGGRAELPVGDVNVYKATYLTSYVKPLPEVDKVREKSYDVYVVFPLNKSNLLPEMGNNKAELAKIHEAIQDIQNNPLLKVRGATITAYASPEGPYDNNARLSRERGQVVIDYLNRIVKMEKPITVATKNPENWDGLIKLMKDDYTLTQQEKTDIYAIINEESDVAIRKKTLQHYEGGRPYKYMLENLYPPLRCTNLNVECNVPDFTVDEGKKILDSQPELLSMDEMYQIANSYPKGSPEYQHVFDIALKTFSQDMDAKVNSSAVALDNNNVGKAESILLEVENIANQTGHQLPESSSLSHQLYNNLGVLYVHKGDYEKAKVYFQKSKDAGNEQAGANLEALSKVFH